MIIHQTAIDHLAKTLNPGEFLRVSVVSGGCNGFSYKFDPVTDISGLKQFGPVVIDLKSLLFLKDSMLVYRSTQFSGILSVENPNAKSTCGCEKSFSV